MPAVSLGSQVDPELSAGLGSRTLGHVGMIRLTLYITILCTWSIFVLSKRYTKKMASETIERINANAVDKKSLIGYRRVKGAVDTMCLLVKVASGSYESFIWAIVSRSLNKQVALCIKKPLLEFPKDYISIDFPEDIKEMHFEKIDYIALDLPWSADQADAKDIRSLYHLKSTQSIFTKPSNTSSCSISDTLLPSVQSKSSSILEHLEPSSNLLKMGAVESLPTVSHHSDRIFFSAATTAATDDTSKQDSQSTTTTIKSSEPAISQSFEGNNGTAIHLSAASECGYQGSSNRFVESEKQAAVKKNSSAKGLLRASIKRYDQIAAGWSKSNAKTCHQTAPGSPKRMPSAEDVGAITRAVERRRLETGYLAIPGSRNGDLDENQKNNCFLSTHFSASMPHLPSRSNGPRDSAQSYASAKQSDKKRLFVESTEGMPTSISGLVNVAPGSSAASSLLMFPIDFTSTSTAATSSIPATNTTLMSTEQSCKQGAVPGVVQRKTRSSSISEIRQRLTRRLSRSSGSSNNRRRSGSSNSSPTTSPVSRSRGLSEGVQQSKRLFTGNSSSCSLIAEELSLSGKIQDSWSAADELVRGLESLSIDGRAGCNSNNDDKDSIRDNCNQDDEEKSTGRLLSESIYLVLEKRLNATTGFDSEICLNTDSESQSDDSKRIKDSGKADSDVFSTNGSLLPDPSTISESLSLLALSDGECREKSVEADVEQEAAGRDEDVVDYDDYVYLSTRKTVKSRNQNQSRCNSMEGTVGNEENSRPVSVGDGEYLNGTRKWWPRRVLPVHNMQYMPKLSKLFTEISQLKASNLSDIRNFDYTCTDCLSLAQPVDEAMMADAAAASLRDCRDIECRNYLLQNSSSSSSSSSATLKEWASSNSLSGLTLADICNGSCINSNSNSSRSRSSVSLDSKGNRKIDYWDILSRCPMRPTSSLALSSLKAMVKSSMASVSSTSSVASSMTFDAYGRRFNNGIGAPLSRRGSRRAGYSTDSSSSDSSDEDTDYSDEENDRRIKEDSVLREFLSSSNSSSSSSSSSSSLGHMRQRGQGNLSSSNGQSQRSGKQRQKRVLSEPMQYILYNSYLRYYGRQGES